MAGLRGGILWAGGPVAYHQRTLGATQPAELACGRLSSRHPHGVPVPRLPVSRSWLSQVRGRLALHYCPGEAGAHRKGRILPEGHLWLHACDHLGVPVRGPQARRPQRSSGGHCQRWHPTVANSWPPFASPWDRYPGTSAGHIWWSCLQPHPGGYPYTRGAKVPAPTTRLQVRRGVQVGLWTVYGPILHGRWYPHCWCAGTEWPSGHALVSSDAEW